MSEVTTPRRLHVTKLDTEELGVITFDETNHGTLTPESTGPLVEELKKAWAEISAQPELAWVRTRKDESRGPGARVIEKVRVKPGEENYIYAVLSTLERKYGFLAELEQ